MKNILPYKLFENYKIDLNENESETKEDLEDRLLDIRDLGVDYEITGRNIYMLPDTENWYRNTGVEEGFRDYLCLRIRPDYKQIEEIIKIIKDCIKYMESQGWKNSITIERGARIQKTNLDEIIEIINLKGYSNLGALSIFLWTK
jgi:hypothetical protein